ncbi:MAG: DUF975 family protein [Eubacteriales bacterium]|nr:DUF975 family protein [Eubacteriales bacterium]
MWIRSELKLSAKRILKTSYWPALLVSIITLLLNGGGSILSRRVDHNDFSNMRGFNIAWGSLLNNFWIQLLMISIGLAMIVGVFFKIFVSSTILVGEKRWFSRNREAHANPSIGQLFSLFRGDAWLKTVGAMLWMSIWLAIWSLLPLIPVIVGVVSVVLYLVFVQPIYWPANWDFNQLPRDWDWSNRSIPFQHFQTDAPQFFVDNQNTLLLILAIVLGTVLLSALLAIPALIKTYSYRMTPWILGDNPHIGYRRALKLSRQMMRGNKFDLFVLDISFIGWYILGLIALVVGTWFVRPYHLATVAELYAVLRKNMVDQGLATMEEFGFRAVTAEATDVTSVQTKQPAPDESINSIETDAE